MVGPFDFAVLWYSAIISNTVDNDDDDDDADDKDG